MKRIILGVLTLSVLSFVGCSSDDNNSSIPKPNEHVKYLATITGYNVNDPSDKTITAFNYSDKNKLVSLNMYEVGYENEADTFDFIYGKDGRLEQATDGYKPLLVSTGLGFKDEAYKIGKVVAYDSNANPAKLQVYYDEYNEKTHKNETKQGTVTIKYDNKPFFAFHTLRAAGVIQALDGVKLNFNAPTEAPQLKLAKELLPNTNPINVVFYLEDGTELTNSTITYTYDNEGYPTEFTVVHIDTIEEIDWNTGAHLGWEIETSTLKGSILYK